MGPLTSDWRPSLIRGSQSEARETRGGVLEIKMCGVYPDGPSSRHSFNTFSCGNGPGNDRYTRVPSAKPHTFCMPTPGVSGACPCVARLNPTHFAFRPLRATERSGSGRPRSTGDRCTRGDPGRRQTKHSGRAERVGSGCLRQRAPDMVRSTLQPRATPKPNEALSKNETTSNWCLSPF